MVRLLPHMVPTNDALASQPLSALLQNYIDGHIGINVVSLQSMDQNQQPKSHPLEHCCLKGGFQTKQKMFSNKCRTQNAKCPRLQACKHLLPCGQGLEGHKEKPNSYRDISVHRAGCFLLVSFRVLKMQCLMPSGFKVGFSLGTNERQ